MDYLAQIYKIVAPGPVSPIFKPGGALEDFNEDLTLIAAALVFLFVLDYGVVQRVIHPKARYFALHATANSLICFFALPDVIRALTEDPLTTLRGPVNSILPNAIGCSIHIYHVIGGFKLSAEDIFHHVTFAAVLGVLGTMLKQIGGVLGCFGAFFLTGLPGGIDYVLLTLQYHDVVSRATEKRINANLNQWLRGPAMTVALTMGWFNLYNGTNGAPVWTLILTCALYFYNGQYYARQAIESYTLFDHRQRTEASAASSINPRKTL
jgi:hypothetical protein